MGTEKDEDFTSRQGFELAGRAAIAGALGVVGQAAHMSPEVAVMTAVMSPIMGTALGIGVQGLLARRFPRFAGGYGKAFGGDPDNVREHAENNRDKEDYHDTMYRAFRLMLDATEPEVVEVLGYMTGRYTFSGKKVDGRFRALGRVLCDLEEGELDDLRLLLRRVSEMAPEDVADLFAVATDSTVSVVVSVQPKMAYAEVAEIDSSQRLFRLLKRDGLAWTNAAPPPPERPGTFVLDESVSIAVDIAVEILSTIDPFPAAQPP